MTPREVRHIEGTREQNKTLHQLYSEPDKTVFVKVVATIRAQDRLNFRPRNITLR